MGGKAEIFSEKKPPIGGYRPLLAAKAAALRFNAKAIVIAPKKSASDFSDAPLQQLNYYKLQNKPVQ